MATSKKNKDVSATTAAENPSPEAKKGPVKTIRIEDVSASIWARERLAKGEPMVFYSVTFERSYRAASGQYGYTRYFDLNDLGKLVTVAQQASEFIGDCLNNPELAKAA